MQQFEDKKKRFKGKNFTETEKECLLKLILVHKEIVENKKTDSSTVNLKIEAWRKIAKQFNAFQTTGMRDVRNLKMCYDNLKMRARKEKNDDMFELFKSSDGISTHKTGNLSELSDQSEPLLNAYDSSSNCCNEALAKSLKLPINQGSEPLFDDVNIKMETPPPVINDSPYQSLVTSPSSGTAKRQFKYICECLSHMTNQKCSYSEEKLNFAKIEHEKKLKILETEQENADVKRKILDIKLENQMLKNKILLLELRQKENQ